MGARKQKDTAVVEQTPEQIAAAEKLARLVALVESVEVVPRVETRGRRQGSVSAVTRENIDTLDTLLRLAREGKREHLIVPPAALKVSDGSKGTNLKSAVDKWARANGLPRSQKDGAGSFVISLNN